MAHVHYTPEQLTQRFEFSTRVRNIVYGLIGVGLLLLFAGYFVAGEATSKAGPDAHVELEHIASTIQPVADTADDAGHGGHHVKTTGTRLLANFLLCSVYFMTLAMGAMFFLAVHQVGNGGWHTAVRRISEAMTMYVPIGALTLVVLFFFLDGLYEWTHIPEGDEILKAKEGFLNKGSFITRNIVYFVVWIGAAIYLRRLSIAQDSEGSAENISHFKRTTQISAAFVFFFAFSYCLWAVDWLMSLEPHWFSTIYGVYIFGASFKASMFTLGLLLLFLKRQGYMQFTNDSHFHDIFKYAFGFTVFWGYIFVAQLLLIWYSNIPEEGVYYIKRYITDSPIYVGGNFNVLFFLNILLCFVIPFFGLMSRNAKRIPKYFVPIAVIALIGHWLDLFVIIMPGAMESYWDMGLMEIGFFLTFAGIFLYVVFSSLTKANLAPINHPYLEESLHHTTGPV